MATKKHAAANKATKGEAKAKGYANPYRPQSSYWAICDTLEKMGKDKAHLYSDFEQKIQKTWDGWKEFSARKARKGVEVHHDPIGKLFVNVGVVRRQADYGLPLKKVGACVNLTRNEKGELQIELCTKNTDQQNPGRKPSEKSAEKKETTKKSAEKKGKAKTVKHTPSKSAAPILSGADAIRYLAKHGNGTKRRKAA